MKAALAAFTLGFLLAFSILSFRCHPEMDASQKRTIESITRNLNASHNRQFREPLENNTEFSESIDTSVETSELERLHELTRILEGDPIPWDSSTPTAVREPAIEQLLEKLQLHGVVTHDLNCRQYPCTLVVQHRGDLPFKQLLREELTTVDPNSHHLGTTIQRQNPALPQGDVFSVVAILGDDLDETDPLIMNTLIGIMLELRNSIPVDDAKTPILTGNGWPNITD